MKCLRSAAVALLVVSGCVWAQSVSTTTYQGKQVVANEILLRLKATDSNTLASVLAHALSGETAKKISTQAPIHLLHSNSRNVDVLLALFAHLPGVAYAEPNYVVKAVATPNDPYYPQLYGMPTIKADQAWNVTTGSVANVIGVVDTGIDYTHPDLAANVWSAPTSFTVSVSGIPITCPAGSHGFNAIAFTCDPLDDNNHGSHTSGSVGAVGNNGAGVTGVNWKAQIMGLKFLSASGSGSTSGAIMAIDFAIQTKLAFAGTATPVNVRVLSNSWGGGDASQSLLDEINLANTNGMLFVAAAGNSGLDNGVSAFYPANFSAPNIVSVAATDSNDNLASFSNYGSTTVHLGAPGVNILSTLSGGQYGYASGTSMSTPHVAGAALLTLAACPTLTTAALKATLLNNVDPVPSLAGKTVTGGRLNVYKAISSCAQTQSSTPIPIFGTGVVSAGVLAADGAADPHYTLLSSADSSAPGPNTYVAVSTACPFPSWLTDGPSSKWIAPSSFQCPGNASGSYTYRTTFNLNGLNPATAILTGQVAADNSVIIKLNGVAMSSSIGAYASWTPFTLSHGFVTGVNTLDFIVTNDPSGNNPTGLRVEVSGAAAPSSASIAVSVSPKTVSLNQSQQQLFTVTVTGSSNSNVTWTLTPNVGSFVGNTYTAPAIISSSQIITAKAVSQADNTTFDTATITLNPSVTSNPIPIFGTGVVSTGVLAADGAADPHYTLLSSADSSAPGPNAYVAVSTACPFPYWLTDGPSSKWIAPSPFQCPGNATGSYTYRTTFNLTGFNPATATLTGQLAVDNSVIIKLNGVAVSNSIGAYASWTPFTISSGFVTGVNTLDFVVTNDPSGNNPTGLRVEVSGTAAPSSGSIAVSVSPKTVTLSQSQQQLFTVNVTGSSNSNVTWTLSPNVGSFTGNTYSAPAIISSSQTITAKAVSQADNTTFDTATITLNPPTAPSPITIFGTGVVSAGVLAADGAADTHYTLLSSADSSAPGPNAYVAVSTACPFPYWLTDGPSSKWIAPSPFQCPGNATGSYTYRTTFNLTGFNPATATLTGQLAVDNSVIIKLNGVAVSNSIGAYASWTPFTISSGFVTGVNTLDFVVTNDPSGNNPTGLRVEVSGTVSN